MAAHRAPQAADSPLSRHRITSSSAFCHPQSAATINMTAIPNPSIIPTRRSIRPPCQDDDYAAHFLDCHQQLDSIA
jgi:hypothetical protein